VIGKLNEQVRTKEHLVQQLNKQKSTIEGLELNLTKLEGRNNTKVEQLKQISSEQLKAMQTLREEIKTVRAEKDQMNKQILMLKNKDAISVSESKKKDLEISKQNEKMRKLLNEKEILNKNNKHIVD